MIRADRLTKAYERTIALNEVSFDVARGEVVAVSGDARSGRSTLLRVLAALTPPTAGHVTIDGIDVATRPFDTRTRTFWVGRPAPRFDRLRAGDYLRLAHDSRNAGRLGEPRVAGLLQSAGVDRDTSLQSLAVERRLLVDLAAAAASGAPVVVVDEPYRDADGDTGERCEALLLACQQRGAAVLLTTDVATATHGAWDRRLWLDAGRLTPPEDPSTASRAVTG